MELARSMEGELSLVKIGRRSFVQAEELDDFLGGSGMTLPVEWKLPGGPISREQLVAEWDLHHRNLMKGPVAS
jgi:hypothetical protein